MARLGIIKDYDANPFATPTMVADLTARLATAEGNIATNASNIVATDAKADSGIQLGQTAISTATGAVLTNDQQQSLLAGLAGVDLTIIADANATKAQVAAVVTQVATVEGKVDKAEMNIVDLKANDAAFNTALATTNATAAQRDLDYRDEFAAVEANFVELKNDGYLSPK